MGLAADKSYKHVRSSLVPSLNRKADDKDIFTRGERPAVYGLLEW